MRKKILVITGTRAEYGLLKPTITNISKSRSLKLHLLVTGMHTLQDYGLTIDDIRKDGLKIDHVVEVDPNDDMLGWLITEIKGIRDYCLKAKPNIILVLGDRDEALAGALVGSHLGISVAHIHGGDTTGDVTVDDKNRDVITSLSSLHFPINKKSQQRIKQILGNRNNNSFVVGNLGIEDIDHTISKKELYDKYKLQINKPLLLLLIHPAPLAKIPIINQITPVLQALDKFSLNIVAIKPNSDTGSNIFIEELIKNRQITRLFDSLSRNDYLNLLVNCDVFVGNSSSGVLEAPFFGTKVVNIGKRQEGRMDYRNMINVNYDCDKIVHAIKMQLINNQKSKKQYQLINSSKLITQYLEKFS